MYNIGSRYIYYVIYVYEQCRGILISEQFIYYICMPHVDDDGVYQYIIIYILFNIEYIIVYVCVHFDDGT